MHRWIAALGFAKAGAIKADPMLIAALAVVSAAASPSAILDSWALIFWLFVGSCCGVLFVLFGDEKTPLSAQRIRVKLAQCFIPGFCLTGAGIAISKATPSAELVLGLALILSVAGPAIVPMLANLAAKISAKWAGDKADGAGQ